MCQNKNLKSTIRKYTTCKSLRNLGISFVLDKGGEKKVEISRLVVFAGRTLKYTGYLKI